MILQDLDGLVYSTDESALGTSSNVYLDFYNRIIKVRPYGYMTDEGVTFQALYGFLKLVVWKESPETPSFIFPDFPVEAITPEQYEIYNGWKIDSGSTPYLKSAGLSFFGIYKYGLQDISFDSIDNSINSTSTDLSIFSNVAAIHVGGTSNNNGDYTISSVTSTKIIVNETLTDESSGANVILEYKDNKTPQKKYMCIKSLSVDSTAVLYYQIAEGGTPTNISHPGDANDIIKFYDIETGLDSDYFKLYNRTLEKTYNEADNVSMGYYPLDAKLYYYSLPTITDQNIIHTQTDIEDYDIDLRVYTTNQIRQVDGIDYEFNIIIDAKGLTRQQVYEKERVWRITDGVVTASDSDVPKNGLLLDELVIMEGNTLKTRQGVFIDGLSEKERNDVIFTDVNGVEHQQTLVVYFTFTVSPNITNYEYRVYQVDNKGSLSGSIELQGEESAMSSTITYSYQYTGVDKNIAVQIISFPDYDYEESITYYTLGDVDQNVVIDLTQDNNN